MRSSEGPCRFFVCWTVRGVLPASAEGDGGRGLQLEATRGRGRPSPATTSTHPGIPSGHRPECLRFRSTRAEDPKTGI